MIKIKICGLRKEEEIGYVNKYLPNYIGFVFAKSRRSVSIKLAVKLKKILFSKIKTVGIFVNEELSKVLEAVNQVSLDCIQLHGDETYEYVECLKEKLKEKKEVEIWKAIRVKDGDSIKKMSCYDVDAFVLDAYIEGVYGGAGKTFNWELASEAGKFGKVILAGGLDTENIPSAVKRVKPFAVDVSSGVETNKYKDEVKIKNFINTVHKYSL